MTDFVNEALLTDEYVLKRLVYVNSAEHGYSEILLDEHLAMFGKNNAGKTATLAGTKLLLFPEVNFSRCEKKFKFVGKAGTYSQEDSYEFYFPDSKSFITLEVDNPEGTFCMILYKTNNYTYGRFFIPLPYNAVRNVFWRESKNDFNESLGIKTVKQFVVQNDGLQTSDPAEIRTLMFEGMRGTKKQRRFCVLPLKDARPDSIEALRNIYQLAFDIKNSESDTLPKAIATMLEMGRGRDEERLSADLLRIADEYSDLVKKQDQLHKLKNAQSVFNKVSEFFEKLSSSYREHTLVYKTLRHQLNEARGSFTERHIEAKRSAAETLELKQQAEKKANQANGIVTKLTNNIELWKDALQQTKSRVQSIKALFTSFGFNTVEETLTHLDVSYSDIEARLKGYRQEDGVIKQLEKNLHDCKQISRTKQQLEAFIKNQADSVAHQLEDANSASIISALNQNLATTIAPITPKQREVITNFTSLFSSDKIGILTFLDTPIKGTKYKPYDTEKQVSAAKDELIEIKQQLEQLEKQINEHHQALKRDNIEKLIEDTVAELEKVGRQRNEIRVMEDQLKKLKQDSERLDKHRNDLVLKKIEFEEAQNKLLKLRGINNQHEIALTSLENESKRIERYEKALKGIQRHSDIDFMVEELSDEVSLNDEWFEKLESLSRSINQFKSQMNSHLYSLLNMVPVEGIDPHKHYDSLSDLSRVVTSYSDEYATLEHDLNQLNTNISSHNQFVSNQISELQTSKQFLANFISEINAELNSKHVSNLSKINLHPEINSRFESLLAALEKQNIVDETLLEPVFYQSLTRFAENYFDKKTRKLKMHDIIDAVHYEYTLEETGERVTKSQSGGTTSTITAFVLSVLLKKITPDYVSLKMPIIVDEVGTLDFNNTKAIIQQISEHGFSIFCTMPTFSGFISQNVGRWIMIDRANIPAPRVRKCYMHILPQHVESFGRNAGEA